jgi:hypothetical protein
MSNPAPAVRNPSTVAVSSPVPPASGRLAVLTALAMGASSIPFPLLPDRFVHRVRGAIVHDVTTRHGLSLTSDARKALAEPDADQGVQLLARKAAELLARRLLRRLGPIGLLATVARGLEVYALGHLLDRYVVRNRPIGPVRIHAEEARQIRQHIDAAVVRAMAPTLTPATLTVPQSVEDLRDELTRWIDTIMLTGASLPSYLERRLEAAFDEVLQNAPGIRSG